MTSQPIIREGTPDDAEGIVNFMKLLADEPDNGTSYAASEQYLVTPEEQRERLRQITEAPNAVCFVVEDGEQFLGYATAIGGARGSRHNLVLAIAISPSIRGRGLGTQLTQRVIDWCSANPIVGRLHLLVFSNNVRAQHIYEKLGFEREGVLRRDHYKHGEYLDSIVMSILFDHDSYPA